MKNDDSRAKEDNGAADVMERTVGKTSGILNSHLFMSKSSSLFSDLKDKKSD